MLFVYNANPGMLIFAFLVFLIFCAYLLLRWAWGLMIESMWNLKQAWSLFKQEMKELREVLRAR